MCKILGLLILMASIVHAQEDSTYAEDTQTGRWVTHPQLQVSPKNRIYIYNNDTVHFRITRLDETQSNPVLLAELKAIKNRRSDTLNSVILSCFGLNIADVPKGDTVLSTPDQIDSLIMDGKGISGNIYGVPNKSLKKVKINQYVYGTAVLKRKNHTANDTTKICKVKYKNTIDPVSGFVTRLRSFTGTFLDVPCDTCKNR